MIILTLVNCMQVFSVSEFDFCYNYVFRQPFQEKVQIIQTEPFTFDKTVHRDLCTRTDNVLFREVNQSTFSIRIDSEFDLNSQPFSLFFFVFQNVTIIDTEINMKLSNSSNQDFAFLVATIPEYSIEIRGSSFQFESKSPISSFYGIANNLTELLTINRSTFTYICSTTISKFYGISSQVNNLIIQNSSFSITTSASTSCGFVSLVLGTSTFKNLTVSGSLSGANTYGFIYENRGACTIQNITYSLVTSGSALNCGFVQLTSGSGTVSTLNLTFVGFTNSQLISEPASYTGTCPCITGSFLQSGLCYCKINSTLINNVCTCDQDQMKWSSMQNGLCICPTGSQLLSRICQCKTVNSFPDSLNKTCICATDATNNTATNTCECPQYSIVQSGACICQPVNSSMVSKVCSCSQTLMKGSSMQSGVCKCPYQSILESSTCKCQPQGSELSGTSFVCNWDQSGGYVSQGNFWCKNAYGGRCCTKCAKAGSQYWCLDDYWSGCTNEGNKVAP
ncbi:Conserved_hypothetical protein [Hexamita inflata]|uniref:Uncharacterized protein n=1 Tax=Hexamita inflata TaxID=28002 RepID=A0AA86PGD1_9EUKA|nr:Conserved hypothetical protein [Hexamita inflata]